MSLRRCSWCPLRSPPPSCFSRVGLPGQPRPLPGHHIGHIEGAPPASIVYPQWLPLGCGTAKTPDITVTAAEGTTADEGEGPETRVVASMCPAAGGPQWAVVAEVM